MKKKVTYKTLTQRLRRECVKDNTRLVIGRDNNKTSFIVNENNAVVNELGNIYDYLEANYLEEWEELE